MGAPRNDWGTYGGWSFQDPKHGAMGRYEPHLTRETKPGTFELIAWYDRGEADMLRKQLGIRDENLIAENSWRSSAWAGSYNAPAEGVWEVDVQMPSRAGVGFALMLWTHDDSTWPVGEINIAEGVTGTDQIMTNLHWGTQNSPRHAPAYHALDISQKHRYRVEVSRGRIAWAVDGRVIRILNSWVVPHSLPVHVVLQTGVQQEVLGTRYRDDFWFEEKFVMTPVAMP